MNTTDARPPQVQLPGVQVPGTDAGADSVWRAAADGHLHAAYEAILQIREFSSSDRLRMMVLGRWLNIPDPGLHRLLGDRPLSP